MSKARYPYKLGRDQHGDYAVLTIKRHKVWIDADQLERISEHAWHITEPGYARTQIAGRTVSMQWLLLQPRKEFIVDHIDQSKLNNRRYNLRIADRRQNAANGRRRSWKGRRKNPYYGINKTRRGWHAHICYKYRIFSSKVFGYAWEAAIAYDIMSQLFNGEFASLNFTENDPRRASVAIILPLEFLQTEKLRIDSAPKPPRPRYRGVFIVRQEPLRFKYDFQYEGKRYQGKIFKTEEEALDAMNQLFIDLGAHHRVQAPKGSEDGVPMPAA